MTIAVLNIFEAVVLVIIGGAVAMYLRMGVELPHPRTGEEVPDTAAGVLLPFVQLSELIGKPAAVGAVALLAAALVVSAIGLVRKRNWARLLTIASVPLRPFLVFNVSIALSRTSVDLSGRFGPSLVFFAIYAWIVWYLFQPGVKRAFGSN